MVAIFEPRILSQSSLLVSLVKSCPRYKISPEAMRPLFSNMPVKVLVKTDLPDPDSPTKAKISPSCNFKEILRMAVKMRLRTVNSTTKSFTSNITLFVVMTVLTCLISHQFIYLCERGSVASAKFCPTRYNGNDTNTNTVSGIQNR